MHAMKNGFKNRILGLLTAFLFLNTPTKSFGQKPKVIDSLKQVLRIAKEDTDIVNTLNSLAWKLRVVNTDTAIILSTQALELSEKIKFTKGIARSQHNLGQYHDNIGNFEVALNHYVKALSVWEMVDEGKPSGPRASTLGSIGNVYYSKGDFQKALEFLFKALKMDEEIKNKKGIANKLINIGNIYYGKEEYQKALDYFFKSMVIVKELKHKEYLAVLLNNIAGNYTELAKRNSLSKNAGPNEGIKEDSLYQKALNYYLEAAKMNEEMGKESGLATILGNVGSIYIDLAHKELMASQNQRTLQDKAFDYFLKALELDEKLGNKDGVAKHLANMGSLFTEQHQFKKAEDYLLKAIAIADTIGDLDYTEQFENIISQLYEKKGEYGLALQHYKKHIQVKDSIFSEENTKKTVRLEMNYEFDKKESAAKLEQEKKEAIAVAESKKQRIIIWSVCGILLLVTAFAIFAYKSYLQKQKANIEITKQKEVIEEKQREILDSILYAKRIQTALLTSEKYIERNLNRLLEG
jgi:tetratricopeptide (TPR) repeat protein